MKRRALLSVSRKEGLLELARGLVERGFEVLSTGGTAKELELAGVKVTGVWTMNVRGKPRRVGQSIGTRPNWKKAIVTLREGDKIDVFEG